MRAPLEELFRSLAEIAGLPSGTVTLVGESSLADLVEQHREMICRIAWKPYMHSLTLRHLLPGVVTPTLLVWGREDAITPLECGEIYQRAIPRSRLAVIEHCGHIPEMEKPGEFGRSVED